MTHSMQGYGGALNSYLFRDSFYGDLQPSGTVGYGTVSAGAASWWYAGCQYQFSFGSYSDCFDPSAGIFSPRKQDGSTLTANNDGTYTYLSRDGVKFIVQGYTPAGTTPGGPGVVTQVTYPSGLQLKIYWASIGGGALPQRRIQSVTSSAGLQIKYFYKSDDSSNYADWSTVSRIYGINNQYEYCSPTENTCALSLPWKYASYEWSSYTITSGPIPRPGAQLKVTSSSGEITRYTLHGSSAGGDIIAIKPPSGENDVYNFRYCSSSYVAPGDSVYDTCRYNEPGKYIDSSDNTANNAYIKSGVSSFKKDGRSRRFRVNSGSNGNGAGTTTYSQFLQHNADGTSTSVSLVNYTNPPLGSFPRQVGLRTGEIFNYSCDLKSRITSYTNGQTASFDYQYDARGNVISMTRTPSYNSGVTPLVTYASFPINCTNQVICNKPTSITDPSGNTTTYTYDPVHGGVLTVTGPADASGVHPQVRYTYAQLSAHVMNASGIRVASDPIWVLIKESQCKASAASGSSCAIAGDEVIKTYQYGPTGGPQDLLLHGVLENANGESIITCYSYDIYGNRISETKPKSLMTSCP